MGKKCETGEEGIDILQLIRKEKNSSSDRYSPLYEFVDSIGKAGGPKERGVIGSIVKSDFSKFEYDELGILTDFIDHSKIDKEIILRKFCDYRKETITSGDDDEVFKRAILTNFITANDKSLLRLEDIENDTVLKDKYPWSWIDCMTCYDLKRASTEISKRLKKAKELKEGSDEFTNLIRRIPAYKEMFADQFQALLDEWYKNMNESDRKNLNEFAELFGLTISATGEDAERVNAYFLRVEERVSLYTVGIQIIQMAGKAAGYASGNYPNNIAI